ncbi:MAG: response regulator transcription factor [Owenweeksia sp.]
MENEKLVNILIVDDHQMFIDGIRSLLRKFKRFNIVADANSGNAALEIIQARQDIDLVMTDISMPEMNGVELVKSIKSDFPAIKVLVLSMYHEKDAVDEIIMAEAEGYVLKNTGKQELANALDKIVDGGTHYSSQVINTMFSKVKEERAIRASLQNLSEREIEVLKLITEELSSQEIGDKLFISKRTVDSHRKNLLQKTNTKTVVGLIKFAYQNRVVEVARS